LYGVNIAAEVTAAATTSAAAAVTSVAGSSGGNSGSGSSGSGSGNSGSGNSGSGSSSGSSSSSSIGPIVGGALGGFTVLCILIGALYYIWRKNPRPRQQPQEEERPRPPPFFPPEEDPLMRKPRDDLEKGGEQVSRSEIRGGDDAGRFGPTEPVDDRMVNEYDGDVPSGRLRYPDAIGSGR